MPAGLLRGDSLRLLRGDLSARLAIGNGPGSPRPDVLLALAARSLSQTRQGSAQGGTFGRGVLVAFSPPCLWYWHFPLRLLLHLPPLGPGVVGRAWGGCCRCGIPTRQNRHAPALDGRMHVDECTLLSAIYINMYFLLFM